MLRLRRHVLAPTLAAVLALAVCASAAPAAKLHAPSNATLGERIMVIVPKVKRGTYTLTLTSLYTSGRVCGRQLGRQKRSSGRQTVRFEVTIPKRLPCFNGPRGNGRRVGSIKVSLGQYGLWFGHRVKRFFWTKRKTVAFGEIGLSR